VRTAARQRAARLLRWYPREWRARYGEEFSELLVADLEERPRSTRRALDVARGGLTARLAVSGLGGRPLHTDERGRRSLAALVGALSIFSVLAISLWAQLTVGWQWSPPDTAATSVAMVVMTVGVVVLGAIALGAAAPVCWLAVRSMTRRGRRPRLFGPICLVVAGLAILVIGTHHFANGWPGTRGHPWSDQGLVPGGVAAYAWASTLFVTTYWLHPAALLRFPSGELAWMAVSPLAVSAVIVGASRVVRRIEFPVRILRYERRLGVLAAVVMALYLAGAGLWITDGGSGPRGLFHIGSIDVVELAAMALLVIVAGRAAECVGPGGRRTATAA
jgi:hypothetical protein